MKTFRLIAMLICVLALSMTGFALEVKETSIQKEQQKIADEPSAVSKIVAGISASLILGTIIMLGVVFFIGWIVVLLYNKVMDWFTEKSRMSSNLIYSQFYINKELCKRNADKSMRKPTWWSVFLYVRRNKVFVENEKGRQLIGKYDGHAYNKNGFMMISLFNWFNIKEKKTELIIIPDNIAEKIVYFDNKTTRKTHLVLRNCEGVDQLHSTDLFLIPLIRNPNTKEFIDFSDLIYQKYFEEYNLRKVINDLNEQFKEAVRDATEINPYVHNKRKTNPTLDQR